jgi:hypothetical protein
VRVAAQGIAAAVVLLVAASVPAESPPWCPPDTREIDDHRYLRALSLDLRGVIPTVEEYEVLDAEGGVPDWLIDEWLDSEEFIGRVVRKHRDLLWPNVTNQILLNASTNLTLFPEAPALYRRQRAANYRGGTVPCLDEPVQYDGFEISTSEQPDGTWREGWTEIAPYWAPDTTVRVCAFDAQDVEISRYGTDCTTRAGFADTDCGCGPALNRCRLGASEIPIRDSFGRDIELRVAANIREDASYLDLFEGRTGYVNGPAVHFWRHQTGVRGGLRFDPAPFRVELLPDLQYTDFDTWVEVPLGEEHAGVLTAPGFLLRFQTNRSRANRFYNSFLCQPFQPPEGGLPTTGDGPAPLDLQVRDGCKYCHALLEPAAAYWGRWPQGGAAYLDPELYPAVREDCVTCATTSAVCPPECNDYYLTSTLSDASDAWLGWLDAYEFRRPEHESHIELGPQALVAQGVLDGRFTDCTVRTATRWLMGRPVTEREEAWIDDLDIAFVAGDYRYKDLVRSIVTSPVYRTVR